MGKLQNKVALMTGSGSGIGRRPDWIDGKSAMCDGPVVQRDTFLLALAFPN